MLNPLQVGASSYAAAPEDYGIAGGGHRLPYQASTRRPETPMAVRAVSAARRAHGLVTPQATGFMRSGAEAPRRHCARWWSGDMGGSGNVQSRTNGLIVLGVREAAGQPYAALMR